MLSARTTRRAAAETVTALHLPRLAFVAAPVEALPRPLPSLVVVQVELERSPWRGDKKRGSARDFDVVNTNS